MEPGLRPLFGGSVGTTLPCPIDHLATTTFKGYYQSANNTAPRNVFDDEVELNCCVDTEKIPNVCMYYIKEHVSGDSEDTYGPPYGPYYMNLRADDKHIGIGSCPSSLTCNTDDKQFLPACYNPSNPSLSANVGPDKALIASDHKHFIRWRHPFIGTKGLGYCPVGYCPNSTNCQTKLIQRCSEKWDSTCDKYLGKISDDNKYNFVSSVVSAGLTSGAMSEAKAASLCGEFPGACDTFLQATGKGSGYCSRYTRKDMDVEGKDGKFDHQQLCGCFLYPDADNYPHLTQAVGVPCDFICSTAKVPRGANRTPQLCKEDVCIIDDVSLNIVNSSTGSIDFSQLCGSCKPGGSCQCYFSDISENIINSSIERGIDFKQGCGGNCFKDNQSFTCPSGPTTGCPTKPCGEGYECVAGKCVLKPKAPSNLWERFLKWWDASNIHKAAVIVGILFIVFSIIVIGVIIFERRKSKMTTPSTSFNPYLYTS